MELASWQRGHGLGIGLADDRSELEDRAGLGDRLRRRWVTAWRSASKKIRYSMGVRVVEEEEVMMVRGVQYCPPIKLVIGC